MSERGRVGISTPPIESVKMFFSVECSFGLMARPVQTTCCHHPPLQFLWPIILSAWPYNITSTRCSFSKKNCLIMCREQEPQQTVIRFRCIGFSMHACGFFFVPKIRQCWRCFFFSISAHILQNCQDFQSYVAIFCNHIRSADW